MKNRLKSLLTEQRYKHSLNVCQTAVDLSKLYMADEEKAYIAGLLHDVAKNIPFEDMIKKCKLYNVQLTDVELSTPSLVHAPLGAKIAEIEFCITDNEILDAITYHTVARENMTLLDKIIYVADMIEPSRSFDGIENIREMSKHDLDKAVLLSLNKSIMYNLKKGVLLHPNSVYARNYLIKKITNN